MSQPSRPRTRGPKGRRRTYKLEQVTHLEDRQVLTPYLPLYPRQATFTNSVTAGNTTTGVITVNESSSNLNAATFPSAAPLVSVSQFAPSSDFGGDIVRIEAGPGGSFGNGVYAISRGAGANASLGAINRPGVIYRVDPATGKSSVFFDLNSVLNQLEPGTGATAANSVSSASGLVNWYDISFDPEGYFDGKPSMFVASVDRSDPNKNVIYRIAPDGTFMGAFAMFTDGQSALKFTSNPSAILVPPTEQQSFLRGIIAGSGSGASTVGTTTFSAFYFNANQYRPGQNISSATLPFGISETALSEGPQTSLTSANIDYISPVYSTFTDFGTQAGGGIPGQPGLSGVQGLNGELLINGGAFPTAYTSNFVDLNPAIATYYRRFEDSAFDYYGYFSQGLTVTAPTTTTTTTTTTFPGIKGTVLAASDEGGNSFASVSGLGVGTLAWAGSLFVADLGTGLSVSVTAPTDTTATVIPVQGGGTAAVSTGNLFSPPTGNLGGRIVRITPDGVVTTFAENFNTSGNYDSSSFQQSSLSITFSADGTTLYAADNDGIWQFKTVASLAGSTSGSIVGLNDLRTLGVPYDGQNSAVAVVDTGVSATNPNFRGRVATGTSVITNAPGNVDTAPAQTGTTTNGNNNGNNNGNGNTTSNTVLPTTNDGHGTLIAGVIAQFVPQATIVPVNVFAPFVVPVGTSIGGNGNGNNNGGGNTGNGNGNTNTTSVSTNSNALSNTQYVYKALNYVATHPYVKDPVRPNVYDRVVAVNLGFGSTESFNSEGVAYRRYPQIVIALKNQMAQLRRRGIQPIAASGQFGAPFGASSSGTGTNNGGNTGNGNNTSGTTPGGVDNSQNTNVGDTQGMSLPAILDEVTSVTGSIPFPFVTGPSTPPTNPTQGTFPSLVGPVLLFANTINIGSLGGTTTGNTTTTTTGVVSTNSLNALTLGNSPFNPSSQGGNGNNGNTGNNNNNNNGVSQQIFYANAILAAANRSITTDYAAPSIDIPTFRRSFAGNGNENNAFTSGGTSLSSAIVTGSFALVSSALSYWTTLGKTGVTSDAYLNMPVGTNMLNFGKNSVPRTLQKYNNPDGINSILEWTAVPIADENNGMTQSTPQLPLGSTSPTNYSEINVANAVAAIEGSVAIKYLLAHNTFNVIDTNHDGLITAQELQNFTDNAKTMGMAEQGAMARLLGGTARIGSNNTEGTAITETTGAFESPDQPDALQRRFNFFDYAAHGQLDGVISINDIKNLSKVLLPGPTAFIVTDRQRASNINYLLDPAAARNYAALQHTQPSYEWVPKSAVAKYRGLSPANFGVDRNVTPGSSFPVFELFNRTAVQAGVTSNSSSNSNSNNSSTSGTTTTPATTTSTTGSTSSSNTTTTPTSSNSTTTGTNTSSTANTNTSTSGTTSSSLGTSSTGSTGNLLQQLTSILNPGTPTPQGNIAPTTTTGSSSTTTPTTPSTSVTTPSATVLPPATPTTQGTTVPASTTTPTTTTTVNQAGPIKKHATKAKSKGLLNDFFDSVNNAFKKI